MEYPVDFLSAVLSTESCRPHVMLPHGAKRGPCAAQMQPLCRQIRPLDNKTQSLCIQMNLLCKVNAVPTEVKRGQMLSPCSRMQLSRSPNNPRGLVAEVKPADIHLDWPWTHDFFVRLVTVSLDVHNDTQGYATAFPTFSLDF